MRRVELETNPSYITVQPSRTYSADYKYNSQYIINVTLILTSLKFCYIILLYKLNTVFIVILSTLLLLF